MIYSEPAGDLLPDPLKGNTFSGNTFSGGA